MIDPRLDEIIDGVEAIKTTAEAKQDKLVSGTNIKTVNNQNILGSGNLDVGSDITVDSEVDSLSTNPVENRAIYNFVTDIDESLGADINDINSKIPAQASSSNQLADKDFLNSSVSTATATFRGTFTNLTDLQAADGDKNDYAFYSHTDSAGNTIFDRYKYVGIKDKRLPDGYTEVYSISGQYINIHKIPRYDWHWILKVSSVNFATNSELPIFGTQETGKNYYLRKPGFESETIMYFGGATGGSTALTGNDIHTFELKSNRDYYVDGTFKRSFSAPTATPTLDAYLLGVNRGNVWTSGSVVCYGFTLYDSEENLLMDLVPCVRDSDGYIGMYDLTGNINPDTNTPFYSGASNYVPLSTDLWAYEYSLNNSSFTADQWAAINSGLVQKVTSTGYDGNATQVLKNINGVIQWVTE